MVQSESSPLDQQPWNVSPTIAVLFAVWRDAEDQFSYVDRPEAAQKRNESFLHLMRAPCRTAGDMIVKHYVDMRGQNGPALAYVGDFEAIGFFWEINPDLPGVEDGSHDIAAGQAFLRDLRDCDLGRCLQYLGRVDFDAADWLDAAGKVGLSVKLIEDRTGNRRLWIDEPSEGLTAVQADRVTAIHALIGGGLGVIGDIRRREVIDLIGRRRDPLMVDDAKSLGEPA